MQILSTRSAVCAFVATTAMMVLFLCAALSPASAQIGSSAVSSNSIGSIRGGLMFLQNSGVRGLVGNTYEGGITITLTQHPMADRTSLGVDYITGSQSGNTVTVVPALVEFQNYSGAHGDMHPYVTYGAGVAYGYIKDPNSTNTELVGGHSSTVMAFMAGYGVDFHNKLFGEVRYLYANSVLGDDISGFQALVGIRL